LKIQSEKIEMINVGELIPHPKNCNQHTQEQIKMLERLIEYQGFRVPLIVQKGTNLVVAGHGRLQAAKSLGMDVVPVIFQEFESEAQLYAYLVSDNSINAKEWGGGLDLSAINSELQDLGPEFNIEMLGIKRFSIEPLDQLDNLTQELQDDLNKKYVIEVEFPNDMEMMDIHDDLLHRGYLVKIK
jgi:hypothetical protein